MKKSKLSILLLFLVMILAISAVSAADDTNDTSDAVMQAVDEAPLEEVASDSDVVGATDDTDIIADEGNNFTSLQTLIENSQYDFLSIDKDYTRVEGDQVIEINRNFALLSSGGNYKIDANNLGGIFKVKEGVTFVLQGLTLVNGNSTNGGAIYNEGTLQINSGTILENNAAIEGGAIYNKGTLTITGSDFNQNTAVNAGGAIYSENGVTIINSNFNANTVTNDFDDATETGGSQGGAIYVTGDKLEITGSKFNGNEATPNDHGDGAAIYAKVTTTTISNTEFTNNKGFIGGAVYLIGADQETPVFDDCLFEGNTALQAGAISLESAKNFKINNSRFINNKAVSDRYIGLYNDFAAAAAIGAADGSNSNIYVDNSKFTGNTVTSGPTENSGFGAAIITTGSLFVDNSEFSNNVADKFAAIRAYYNANEATVTITNSNFTSNKATKGNAAAIYTSASKTTTVTGSRFVDNEAAGNGGAIYADGALTVEDSYFSGNKANNTANAIYANGKLVLSGNTIEGDEAEIIANGDVISQINVTILNNDTVEIFGTYMVTATVIDDSGNLIADINGIKFVTDVAEVDAKYNATTKLYEGLLILPAPGVFTVNASYTEDNIIVKTATIKNYKGTFQDLQKQINDAEAGSTLDLEYDFAYSPDLDGASYVDGVTIGKLLTINGNGYTISGSNAARIFKITVATTINNVTIADGYHATNYGGAAIYATAALTVTNTNFTNNGAEDLIDKSVYGAVRTSTSASFDNCIFTNNYGRWGGAIGAEGSGTITIKNSKFENNNARQGGAIDIEGYTLNIGNTEFIGNDATFLGGAIHTSQGTTTTVTNSKFERNTDYQGGAICSKGSTGSLTIDNSEFIANEVTGTEMPDKETWSSGGAIWVENKLTLTNSNFTANKAEYNGGAVYVQSGNNAAVVDNCRFVDNEAGIWYGALFYSGSNTMTVSNSYFDNNKADGEPNAINLLGGKLVLSNNTITGVSSEILIRHVNGYPESYVESQINVTVLDNQTKDINSEIELYAAVTDDNGNVISDSGFKFLVGTTEVNATFNPETNYYEATYNPTAIGEYVVNMTSTTNDNLVVKTATLRYIKGTYTDLQNQINEAAEEGVALDLAYNFTYDDGIDGASFPQGVLINQPITINGNGYTISGNDKYRILLVNASATLTNITFTKGNAKSFTPTVLTGGAVQVARDIDQVVIENCVFESNKAMASGGAIYALSKVSISGSTFTDNTAMNAGAIHLFDDAVGSSIVDSNFIGNNATGSSGRGGAIQAQAKVDIWGTNFTNNFAKGYSGAIEFTNGAADSIIINSKFENNEAKYAGAIQSNCKLTIIGSNFTDNKAQMNGIVLVLSTLSSDIVTTIAECNFTDADNQGFAVVSSGNLVLDTNTISSDILIKQGTVSLNKNTIAGIINNSGNITSKVNATVLDNTTVIVKDNTYTLNATYVDDNDNIIYDTKAKFTVDGAEIETINYNNGLYTVEYTISLANETYTIGLSHVNKESLYTGIIRTIKGTFTDLQNKINNAAEDSTLVLPYDFTYNAEIDGDALKAGVVINKPLTVDGNGSTISGADAARIFQLNADSINIINTTFTNGHANTSSTKTADWGGAIYSNGAYIKHVISDCKFYNNTAYNGGAIYLGGDASDIIGCEFEDNNATASGGAVFLYGWNDAISDSTFKFNMADELGGAVACYSSQQGAEISNSVFIGNVAFKNGGAVSVQRATGKITDSNFTGNTAPNGGAVYWSSNGGSISGGEFIENEAVDNLGGAIFAEGAGLTISSTFTGNYAENGGAIAVFKDATITESNFTNNTADNYGGAVYVNGSAKLDITQSVMKNNTATVGSSIYSNGTIESTIINATILENNTWYDAELGKLYVLNATLTDDMGNSIYDPNFRFTVNGDEIAVAPKYDDETGLYTIGYTIQKADLNIVSTSYNAASLQVFTGALDIPLANVTKFTVFVSDILEGENATVWITLIGVNDEGLNSTVTVIVNNKEYPVPVVNGTGNRTIENLTHGQYPVVAMFEDPNYNSEINSTVFNVKGQSVLNITELTVAEYGDVIEITINLTDTKGNPISGIVVIDDVIQVLVYENGIGVFVIDNQPDVGNYTFQAVYDGNDDYFGDLAIFNVTVTTKAIDPEDIVVDIPNINEFGDKIPITITSPVDGTYTVNINGTTVQVEVINSTGNATVTLDKPGIYNATVNIDEEEYTLETITTDDFEYLVTPEFNVVITGTYPNAEITITGPAGTYHVLIDGQEEINITREESGLPTVYTIEGIDAGDYTAFVSFDAHDEYYGDVQEVNFTVAKANIILSVIPDDSVEGEAAAIYIYADSDVNTTVRLIVDDEVLGEYSVTNGSAIVNVTEDQGQHNVIVEIADDNYDATPASGSFYVKYVTELTVSTDNEEYDYGEDVTISVKLNATGQSLVFTVSLTVGEDEYNVLVEYGDGELVLSDLPVGNYTILSYFNGDNINNYTEGKEVTFKVNPKVINPSDVDCSFEGDYDDGLNITIKSPVDTTYIVDIEGYGPVTVEVINGTGSAIVEIEEPGDYDANISIADGNYSLKPINKQFKYKAAPKYTVNITGTYPNAKVTIEGTYGNYSVYIDEGHQLVITVKDGVGSQEVSGLFAGEYKAHVEFEEQDGYHSVDSWVNFTIDKAPLDIDDLEVIGDKVVESPINITFTLPVDVDPSSVSAYMDGVPVPVDEFIINETTGVYTLPLDGFAASEGHYFVVQVTDSNYEDAIAEVSFLIEKANSTVTIEVDGKIGVMGGATVNVTVSNNAAGYIKIDNDGVIDVVEITDGTYSFEIYDLQAGDYYINVTFLGNDKYLSSSAIKEFNVPQSVINPNITDVTTPILEGQDAVITVTMDNDLATGNVTVFVDNEEYDVFVLDDYASAIIEIIGLTEGTHTIVVQYNGDDNYKSDKNATVDITVYGNVVTNETFFSYFDEYGVLRDNVPFDELIFSGEFSDLGITHVIVDNIVITGDDAKLTNIGFVANGNVALSNMTLIADTSLGGLIDVAEDDVVITGMDISYTVGDEDAVAIDVTGVNNVIIVDSKITFASEVAEDSLEKSAMAINIDESSNVIIEGNDIDTTLIGVDANYGMGGLYKRYGMMGVGNVNPVRILGSSDITFNSNTVNSKLSDIKGYWPTIQSVLVVASKDLEFEGNNFTMIDDVTAAGTPSYLYSFTFGMNDGVDLYYNNFFMSTEGGATATGTAYALQIVSSNMTIIGNNITSISNGPNLGIYAVCDYNTFDDFELYIADNIINVTGKATNTTTWYDLVSGIEIGHGDIVIENNIINVYNKAGYINGTYVYGISYAQGVYEPTFDIYDNTVIVPDADYAIAIDHDAYAEVTDNYLIAHELYGDAAVKTTNEESIVIENYPQDLNITVTIENCSVVDPVEVSVTTNPLFSGVVIVNINGKDYEINITDGIGGDMLSSLPASIYTAVASYEGDYYFNADENTTTFEVFRLDGNMTIAAGDVIVDEPLVVNITYEFADGPVTVYVDDNEISDITLEDGFVTFTIPKESMTAGNHSIVAIFNQTDDYVAAYAVYNFTVEKAEEYEFDVNLTIDEIDIGENATINVTLPEDANGIVTVSVDGEEVTFEDVVNGTATVTIPADAFTAGKNNTISVTYSDDKYGETTVSKEIAVNKLPFELTASAENIELGQNATIVVKLPEGADGTATVTLQGKAYPVVNGTVVIENLGEGTYTADVLFEGDSIYEDNMTTVTFNVTKVEISPDQAFNITTPENATSPEIKLDLPDDATGFLLVDIDGQQTHVPVVNGTATAEIPNLAEGTYNATITYTGDEKYAPITTTKEINVTSNVPENALSIPDSAKSDEPTTYSISLPSDAGGYLEVDVDGTKYAAPLNNGTASVTIPALSEGSHNVTVKYTGDDKYTPVTKATTLNVTAPVFKLSKNKDIKVVYSATATYKVLVTRDGKAVGAGEKVTIKFNGKTYTATTDKNGYATLKLNTKVKVKKYTITATYKGVTVTNKVTVQHVIKAKNAKIKKSKKVNKIKVKTKKVNKKYLKGKKLTLKIKGKKLKAKINKKGVATFKLKKSITKKLKAGKKYKYTVIYGKDKVTKKITVKK